MDITTKDAQYFARQNGANNIITDGGICAIRSSDMDTDLIGFVFRVRRQNESHAEWTDYFVTDPLTAREIGNELLKHAELAYPSEA